MCLCILVCAFCTASCKLLIFSCFVFIVPLASSLSIPTPTGSSYPFTCLSTSADACLFLVVSSSAIASFPT